MTTQKRKYKVVIAYDGTGYSGWQYQDNALGIQQVVEEALAYLEGAPVRIFGSSRRSPSRRRTSCAR